MRRMRKTNSLRRRQRIIAALERGRAIASRAADSKAEADLAERRATLRRWVARIGWTIAQMDRIEVAQKAADAAWTKLIEAHPDGDTAPPEAGVLERLLAEVEAVIENDRWPRHLHWSL